MKAHHLSPRRTLRTADAKDQDDFTEFLSRRLDETVRRLNFHPVRAPAKPLIRSRVTLSDQVYPESVAHIGLHDVGLEWQSLFCRRRLDPLERRPDLLNDHRRFDERVRRNHIDRLR